MSKQTHRQAQRLKPLGPQGLATCRRIMIDGYSKINEVMVDSFSAAAIVAVYDRLNAANQARLVSRPVALVAAICFKVLNSPE